MSAVEQCFGNLRQQNSFRGECVLFSVCGAQLSNPNSTLSFSTVLLKKIPHQPLLLKHL